MTLATWKLTAADAIWLCENVERHAQDRRIAIAVAVVDEGGHLLRFTKTDGTKVVAATIAIAKAWTAAVMQTPAGALQPRMQPGASAYGLANAFPGQMIPIGGGQPIFLADHCVGGIGLTGGGSAEEDATIAADVVKAFVNSVSPSTDRREGDRK